MKLNQMMKQAKALQDKLKQQLEEIRAVRRERPEGPPTSQLACCRA